VKKTTVLLDAGGILLDESEFEDFACETVTRLLRANDSRYSAEDYWADTREAVFRFCTSTPRAVFWKRCGADAARYTVLFTAYKDAMERGRPPIKLYAEMEMEIPALAASFRLVCAGQYSAEVYDLLERHGLAKHFANRLSQDDFAITKPDPRYVARIAERSGVATEACIMVGDRIDKNVIPGKQNGMGTVFVRTGIYRTQEPRMLEEAPDITLDSLNGLANAVVLRWGT